MQNLKNITTNNKNINEQLNIKDKVTKSLKKVLASSGLKK
jgi:hypothetical protein